MSQQLWLPAILYEGVLMIVGFLTVAHWLTKVIENDREPKQLIHTVSGCNVSDICIYKQDTVRPVSVKAGMSKIYKN